MLSSEGVPLNALAAALLAVLNWLSTCQLCSKTLAYSVATLGPASLAGASRLVCVVEKWLSGRLQQRVGAEVMGEGLATAYSHG
jgi:hypothetical protein